MWQHVEGSRTVTDRATFARFILRVHTGYLEGIGQLKFNFLYNLVGSDLVMTIINH